jgi:hypothetical protein
LAYLSALNTKSVTNATKFVARKGIPADVREAYARLYKVSWEERLTLPANTPNHEAKKRHGEWLAEIETRIATLQAATNATLRAHATSDEAKPLVAKLAAMIDEHAHAVGLRKNKRGKTAAKLRYATGAFLANLYSHD